VRIPLDAVRVPWQPVPFRAEAVAPGARRVLLSGVVFRRPAAAGPPELSALCVTCTHEQCQVDFVTEPAKLPRTDHVMTQPVFLCACHSSVFDAAGEGAWISGPAPRGLYRFRTRVDGDTVVITEIEEEALLAV
jgi:Rieske Fe-S protein